MPGPWDFRQSNPIDYRLLAGLSDALFGGYDRGVARGREAERRRTLADLQAQSGDAPAPASRIGAALLGIGDLEGGLVAAKLAESQSDRDLARTKLAFDIAARQRELSERERANQMMQSLLGGGTPSGGDAASIGGSLTDRIIRAESGGNPNARNPNSSATGLGQFIEGTWMSFIKERYPELAGDPQRALALRTDPKLSREAVEWYAGKNAQALSSAGLPVNDTTLKLAHFAGPQGAVAILRAPPDARAADILGPAALRANPWLANMTAAELVADRARKVGASNVGKGGDDASEPDDSGSGLGVLSRLPNDRLLMLARQPGLSDADRSLVMDEIKYRRAAALEKQKDNRPTDLQRNLAAENRSREQRGLPPLSVIEFERQRRQDTFETQESKNFANQINKVSEEALEGGAAARKLIASLDAMERAMRSPGFYSGVGGEALLAARKAVEAATNIKIGDGAGPMELFRALSNDVVVGKLGGSLGTAISNADVAFMKETAPSLSNTPEGNQLIIDMTRKLAQRGLEARQFTIQYRQKKGSLDGNYLMELEDLWSRPFLTQDERQRAQRLVSGGQATSGNRGNADRSAPSVMAQPPSSGSVGGVQWRVVPSTPSREVARPSNELPPGIQVMP